MIAIEWQLVLRANVATGVCGNLLTMVSTVLTGTACPGVTRKTGMDVNVWYRLALRANGWGF